MNVVRKVFVTKMHPAPILKAPTTVLVMMDLVEMDSIAQVLIKPVPKLVGRCILVWLRSENDHRLIRRYQKVKTFKRKIGNWQLILLIQNAKVISSAYSSL